MNAASKVLALTIIAALLCVPALTRVHQRLQHANAGTLISSYSKSGEAPPEKLVAPPPLLVVAFLLTAPVSLSVRPAAPASDVPPVSRSLAPPDALRAPPLG